MKVLHKAKQLLQGFVLPGWEFHPRGFLSKHLASNSRRANPYPALPKPTFQRVQKAISGLSGGKSGRFPVFATISFALLFSLFFGLVNNSANAVVVSSDSNQCEADVDNNTGVSIQLVSGRCVITFVGTIAASRTNSWTAPAGVTSFDVLVVAGGGGGGPDGGSGGGSGSMYEARVGLNGNTGRQFSISVGGGGARGIHTSINGESGGASAGGDSTFGQSNLGFSIVTKGGQPGDWPTSFDRIGGSGGVAPTAVAGSTVLSNVFSSAGQRGGFSRNFNVIGSGYDGVNGVTSSLFSGVQVIGSGGGGAIIGSGDTPGGAGGIGGGGRGGGGANNVAWTLSGHGVSGSGGGGGGGSRNANHTITINDGTRTDYNRNGAWGGSGSVRISYTAPSLAVATAANGARLNVDMLIQPRIQLRNSSTGNLSQQGVTVTVTPSSGGLSGATQTTDSSGVAQFTNLRFTSGTLGTITLTYSAPGYTNVTQTIKLQTIAVDIYISTQNSVNGNFVQGVWLADSASISYIKASELATALTSNNVSLESAGYIWFDTSLTSSSTNNLNLSCTGIDRFLNSFAVEIGGALSITCPRVDVEANLKTTGGASSAIRLKSTGRTYINKAAIQTAGADVVVWSGSNGLSSPGSYIYIEGTSSITTGGGKIWLAGGKDDGGTEASITANRGAWSSLAANDGYPDGYAVGTNESGWNSSGILLNSGVSLLSGGGDIFLAGAQGPATDWGTAHIEVFPGVRIDSGSGRIAMWGKSLGTSPTQGIALNRDGGDSTNPVIITSNASSSDAITIYSDSSLSPQNWSRGITSHWWGKYDAKRGHQGTQILATALGGGVTMTGIGSGSISSSTGNGLYLDFIDILARSGPITLNGDSSTSTLSHGVTFGLNTSVNNAVRLGGWAPTSFAVGGASLTTASGTFDFSSSSSNVTINADSIWNNATTMAGVLFGTTGNVSILPANLSSGIIQSTANFKAAQTSTHFMFERLQFPVAAASITVGRSTTTTNISLAPSISATGTLTVTGGNLSVAGNASAGSIDIKPSGTYSGSGSLSATNGTVSISGGTSVAASGAISATGNVTLRGSGTFENTGSITSNSGNILVQADDMALGTSVNIAAPTGSVTLTPQTNNMVIDLGTNVSGRLSLTDAELDRISATTLRIGALSGTNTGNIEISSAISPALSPTVALRTGGAVSSSGNRSITGTNLGVQASGIISLAASNVISGNLALNSPASSLTFNQSSGSFTPATVDGITPEYGVPNSLTVTRVPTTQTETRTLGEIFSLVPEVTLRDKFSNTLIAANSQSSRYSITVTRPTGSGTLSGTLVRSTTAGVASFDNLRIITTPGTHTLSFTATAVSAPALIVGSPSATTGTYNIRTAQTITFTSMVNRTMGVTNTFTVAATASSGLTVAFSADPDTSSVCTVSGTTVTMVTGGTCRINANQAGDTSFAPATQVQQSFTVSRALELTTPPLG